VQAHKERPGGNVTLTLSYEETVVLAELLWRWERDGTQEGFAFEDQAEQRVLWDLTACFEPLIDEVFDNDGFEKVLSHSRWKVRDSNVR
jgi:hypothetical protein